MSDANDYDFDACVEAADERIAQGCQTFQKFTCAGCGRRLTIDVPNTFYTFGKCADCGHETDIRAQGCNYVLVAGRWPAAHQPRQ